MTALISKLKLQHSLSTSAWPNYDLDVLNITMHTEVVIHSKVKVGVLRPVQQPGSNTFNECLCVWRLEQNLWLT